MAQQCLALSFYYGRRSHRQRQPKFSMHGSMVAISSFETQWLLFLWTRGVFLETTVHSYVRCCVTLGKQYTSHGRRFCRRTLHQHRRAQATTAGGVAPPTRPPQSRANTRSTAAGSIVAATPFQPRHRCQRPRAADGINS